MSTILMPSTVTTKTVLSTAASFAASAVLLRTIIKELIPRHFQDHIFCAASSFLAGFSSKFTIIVQQFHGIVPLPNEMYMATESYLASKISPSTRCLQVAKQQDSNGLEVTMEKGETIVDLFQGSEFKWKLISEEKEKSVVQRRRNNPFLSPTLILETKFFILSFHKKHKEKAFKSYLPHILQQFKEIKQEEKTIKIHTADCEHMYHKMGADAWHGVNLDHPATFDTLAMEPEQKRKVKEDLERFARRKDYYRRVGKAWKRGYLLHGPPGTGKSSLIAAMANFLKFDIYDLELTEVRSNSNLRKLLVGTANRSIIVVEDIDCTIELPDRKDTKTDSKSLGRNRNQDDKVTLSGLLNFIDGLWSSCGDERIIIFTTNHKERLDPALLRPGRMDMHIHMSYCSPSGFKTLLSNYHNVDDHPLCAEVDLLLREVEATPAEVAEELLKSDDTEVAMRGLIEFLLRKRAEVGETAEGATVLEVEVSKGEEAEGLRGGEGSEGE